MNVNVNEAELSVEYLEEFYDVEKADSIFLELHKLPFKSHSLEIYGRKCTPLRKICAYGDAGSSYSFSGTSVPAEPWTPCLQKLKEDVEAKVGHTFNFVLLNLYENGRAKIGAHKDNERDLDKDTPIVTLSFGATRQLIFKRKNHKDFNFSLSHGSMFIMNSPTNQHWTHEIPGEPDIVEPRISLTFRKINCQRDNPSIKRKFENIGDDLSDDDWLGQCLQKDNSAFDILPSKYFHLTENVVCCVKEFNGDVRVDIRRYKLLGKRRIPTKEGIVINPLTWYYFCEEIHGFNFLYKDSSFIANNCLLALNLGGLHLQQIECKPNESLNVKIPFITLTQYEVVKMLELEDAITTSLIELMWINILPRKISHIYQNVLSPLCNNEETIDSFIKCLELNMEVLIKSIYHCQGCIVDSFSQLNHDCMYQSTGDMFKSLGWRAWLLLDVHELVKTLSSEIPTLNVKAVKQLTLDDYKRLLFVQDTSNV